MGRKRKGAPSAVKEQHAPSQPPLEGRVTHVDEDGVRWEGRMKDGERHGRGTLYFPDGACQAGRWINGVMSGPGEYIDDDGSRLQGTWEDGDLCGRVQEFDPAGFKLFDGLYEGSRRHGKGTMLLPDGGKLEGTFVDGVLDGTATYWYPGGKSGLKGTWQDGEMAAARYFEDVNAGVKARAEAMESTKVSGPTLRQNEASDECFCLDPLVPDPYEHARVCVGSSRLCGTAREGSAAGNSAGQGLFLRQAVGPDELVSWYNGVKVPHRVVDRRAWNLNDNTISLDMNDAIDVPREVSLTRDYCATLGHKANHSFSPNAKYAPAWHPRFGNIMSIRTLVALPAGAEILVHYKYTHEKPRWYRQLETRVGSPSSKK